MSNTTSLEARKMSKSHKRKQAWRRIVRTMAMVIIFCTTYALILPAITMQSDTICGMENHTHDEGCYETALVDTLVCTIPEEEGHTHGDGCWTETEELSTALTCTLQEDEEHSHGDGCWTETKETVSTFTCTLEEKEGHTHADDCWTQTETLTGNLICMLAEHTHNESCYPLESEEEADAGLRCGYAEHIHHDGCEDCTIIEHIHEAKCILDQVDMSADLETEQEWEAMAGELELTGNWSQDLLILAQSQLGYSESSLNVVLSGEELHGYTRYADWYGTAYQDWNSLFVAFCMHYAGIPGEEVPVYSDAERWYEKLEEKGLLQDDQPQPGSIIFWEDDDGQTFAAVVEQVERDSENPDKMTYRVIAGDVSGRVDYQLVKLSQMIAVCDLEKAQLRSQGIDVDTPETETEGIQSYTAHTENYTVTVTCPADLVLPEGAELRVMEYAKDSETYIRRCAEAGYELEWLLNIGFFLGDEELDLDGSFEVSVTSKLGEELSEDITHFADSGTEMLTGNADDEMVSFTSDGFSDFGGGNARAATAQDYSFTTVNPSQLKAGVNYVMFTVKNNQIIFLNTNGDELAAITTGNVNNATNIGAQWTRTQAQMGNTNPANFTWQVTYSNNNRFLVCQNNNNRLALSNGWGNLSKNGSALYFTRSGNGVTVGTYANNRSYHLRYENGWRASWYNDDDRGQQITFADTIYFAEIVYEEVPGPPDIKYDSVADYPHAVHTGEVNINRLRFYNLCENGESIVSGLEGCVFEITGPTGKTYTVTSTGSSDVTLPDGLPDGEYTIEEISVPEGYVRDVNYKRTFVIEDGNLSSAGTIGTFINHSIQQITTDKTAEVKDYANRIYKVDLSANANLREFELEPIDVLFVVDQSNSMLFPAHLVSTGKTVTLRRDGVGNDNEMNRAVQDLDPAQVYYVIADPNTTSTVWAIWYDGIGKAWACQDASYYAKAKHNNGPGYSSGGEIAYFPDSSKSYATLAAADKSSNPKQRCNGSGLGQDLKGGSLGDYIDAQDGDVCDFVLYTASNEYNRLHYLQEALSNLIYQLADANGQNRVSLTRFTKIAADNISDCEVAQELSNPHADPNPNDGFDVVTYADYLVQQVGAIQTTGGTRQDYALEHIAEKHLDPNGEHYKGVNHTYTLLITDGAPVSSNNHILGTPGSNETTADPSADQNSGTTIYGRIKGWGKKVREASTLLTVGLGMENVQGGKTVLQEIASSGDWFSAMDDASKLSAFVQKLLFENYRASGTVNVSGNIVDEISNSFYPIAWVDNANAVGSHQRIDAPGSDYTWVLLKAGDWITLDGMLTSEGASNAAGQLLKREDGTYYVQWLNQTISGSQWNGTIYVKAKEDFIGGNAIDTNKSDAVVTATVYRSNGEAVQSVERTMKTPTVNVRLLDLNDFHSEVTVYLGDKVNTATNAPIDSLKGFYEGTAFTKLISDGGDVLNKITAAYSETDGLEEAVLYLRYAMGRDLDPEEWTALQNGDTIEIPYLYDNDSSHGNVGYFTISLEMQGSNTCLEHDADEACQPGGQPETDSCKNPAERYTLNVVYTAYRLGQNGRPEGNVHNGTRGPGTEVGAGSTLPTGLGVVDKENVHEVHVISGKIEIWKYFAEGIADSQPRTFTFNLNKIEDGVATVVDSDTITIGAGQTAAPAPISFEDLPRGIYTVTEASDDQYAISQIQVLNETNCFSIPGRGETAKELTFVMGNDLDNRNVIGYAAEQDPYTSYVYPPDGVYGAAAVTNGERVFEAEIPVEKVWDDGNDKHQLDQVYLVLYLNDSPVVDVEGNARILMLDHSSDWKGSFTVPLTSADDSLSNYNYSVREVSKVRDDNPVDWNPAILENDGSTLLYYEHAVEQGLLIYTGGYSYVVTYHIGTDGKITVNNSVAVTLPKTGGMGTAPMYTIGGLLITAAACVCGYDQRRKRRGEAVE